MSSELEILRANIAACGQNNPSQAPLTALTALTASQAPLTVARAAIERHTLKHAVYILVLLLGGCDQLHSSDPTRSNSVARYQIVANSEGGAWKLDVITGEMKYCPSFAPVASGPVCYKAIEK